jgi:hypothetical protein
VDGVAVVVVAVATLVAVAIAAVGPAAVAAVASRCDRVRQRYETSPVETSVDRKRRR